MADNWMPGAIKLPVDWAQDLSRHGDQPDAFVMHVDAGGSTGPDLHDYFEQSKAAASHFFIEYGGDIYQYQPISARSGADYGSDRTVSAETAGKDDGSDWTDAQIESLAKVYAWLVQEHGFANRMMKSSQLSEKGLGTHRLGVDGNFPSSGVQAGRKQRGGGELWSGAYGKTCPTNKRQDQWDDVYDRAQGLISGKPDSGGSSTDTQPDLTVDGKWGEDTTRFLQKDLGSKYKDGEVSRQNSYWKQDNPGLTTGWEWFADEDDYKDGSPFIKDFQTLLNHLGYEVGTVDGLAGEKFFKGIQRWMTDLDLYDGKIDGEMWKPSTTIKALQKAHNKGLVKKAAKGAGLRD